MSADYCEKCGEYIMPNEVKYISREGKLPQVYCPECAIKTEELEIDACTRLTIEYKKVKIIYQDLEGEFKEIDFECLDWKGFENQKVKYV